MVTLNRDATAHLEIGIGLHSGPVIVGGSLTKQLGEPLLLTAATRELLREAANLRDLGQHPIRGMSAPVALFALE